MHQFSFCYLMFYQRQTAANVCLNQITQEARNGRRNNNCIIQRINLSRDIRLKIRKKYSAEKKVGFVLEGLRGKEKLA